MSAATASVQSLPLDGGRGHGLHNARMTSTYSKYRHNAPGIERSSSEEREEEEEEEDLDREEEEEEEDDDDDDDDEFEDEESPEVADEAHSTSSSEVVLPFSWYKDQLSPPVYSHHTQTHLQQDEPNVLSRDSTHSPPPQMLNDEANEPSEPT